MPDSRGRGSLDALRSIRSLSLHGGGLGIVGGGLLLGLLQLGLSPVPSATPAAAADADAECADRNDEDNGHDDEAWRDAIGIRSTATDACVTNATCARRPPGAHSPAIVLRGLRLRPGDGGVRLLVVLEQPIKPFVSEGNQLGAVLEPLDPGELRRGQHFDVANQEPALQERHVAGVVFAVCARRRRAVDALLVVGIDLAVAGHVPIRPLVCDGSGDFLNRRGCRCTL
mmetsp:Transcript_50697/g.107556  ORF Transcript_50697/g.107556 Transcript_50697/m.107556 type:complete len:228 (-) Transcript_50697:337-1020(-)